GGLHLIGIGVDPAAQPLARGILDACTPLARHALQVGRQASQAQAEASIDLLTGLVNRRGWQHGLVREQARCVRHHLTAVVAVVDVDELKAVNDTYGHLCGDLIIVLVAEALRSVCRAEDVIARLGGDEFAVLMIGDSHGLAPGIANRLRDAMADMGVAASIGTAEASGAPLAEALTLADQVMYRHKGLRRRVRLRRLQGAAAADMATALARAHAILRDHEATVPAPSAPSTDDGAGGSGPV
ncbi:MAG: GGDEF domain-containing protein, partial [Acidimicrobiales bacterium]